MRFKQFRSRIERLRRCIKGGECEGCNRTAMAMMMADTASITPELRRCPECGNPNVKIPLSMLDSLTEGWSDEEMMLALERVCMENKLNEKLGSEISAGGSGPESEGDDQRRR